MMGHFWDMSREYDKRNALFMRISAGFAVAPGAKGSTPKTSTRKTEGAGRTSMRAVSPWPQRQFSRN
jgi:hypothetical protein